MNGAEAVVCVAGLAAATGLIIFTQINKKKEKEKFDQERDLFTKTHKIDELIKEASVANEKLETAEDKALAKDLMERAKDDLESCKDISSYKAKGDHFLNLYSALTEGDDKEVKANLLYFKLKEDRAEKLRAEQLANTMQKNLMKMEHQHDLDKIGAYSKIISPLIPDAYTMGKLYKGAFEKATDFVGSTIADKVTEKVIPEA